MALRKNYRQLIDEAMSKITTLSLDEARAKFDSPDVLFVDIRDVRELDRAGMIPGAFHVPRGMLEFWVDPESPYHKRELGQDKELVLYCQSGWRSALATATLVELGVERIAHIEGGFAAWQNASLPVARRAKPK
jgi:rhodanese-related sulfurtransferase